MNSKRLYFLLLATTSFCLIGVIAGAFVINSLLENQSTHLAGLKQQNETLTTQQVGLIKAKQEITTYGQLEQITKTIVPEDKDQAEAVREIVNIASASGVPLSSITFPASTLGGGKGSTPSSTPSSSSPSSVLSAKPGLSQLQAVKDIPGVYSLQIVLENQGSPVSYNQFYNFLAKLENNRRTAQVASLSIQPDKSHSQLTFTITLNEYIKPS